MPKELTPRDKWLILRIEECLDVISTYKDVGHWHMYREKVNELGKELVYLTTEWEKYYSE